MSKFIKQKCKNWFLRVLASLVFQFLAPAVISILLITPYLQHLRQHLALEEGSKTGLKGLLGLALMALGLMAASSSYRCIVQTKKSEKGKKVFCSSGIHRYCRYPEYLGEMLFWCGLHIMTFDGQLHNFSGTLALTLALTVALASFKNSYNNKAFYNNPSWLAYKARVVSSVAPWFEKPVESQ